jgi:plasmid stabilization system protein ParE
MTIHYTHESISDLARLREFIAENNPSAASRIATELKQGIKRLAKFPNIGIAVINAPNPQAIRDLYIGNYIIRYLIANNDIYILRLWHDKESERNS